VGEAEVECLRQAARQWGVLRRDQALAWLSPDQLQRRLAAKMWEPLFPRVFRVEGAPRSWRQDLKALCLWAGADYALSHRTAAALHGFRRFAEGALELSAPRHLSLPPPVRLHQVNPFGSRDLETLQGFRVTSVTRTLLDLAAVVSEADLRATVDEALQRKRTSVERLAIALAEVQRGRGTVFLRKLVHEYQGGDGPCESELEARVFELIDASSLPRPQRQRAITVAGRLRRLDFCYPKQGVIVEADGYAFHSSPLAFEKDRQRANSLALRGFLVLQWTWKALQSRPRELLSELKAALAGRVSWDPRQPHIS
jgi:very-short-patch-repair endonuclease